MLRFLLVRMFAAAVVTALFLAAWLGVAHGAEPTPAPGPRVVCRPVPGAVWRSEPGPDGSTVLRRATVCVVVPPAQG